MRCNIMARGLISMLLVSAAWLGTPDTVKAAAPESCGFCVFNELCVEISQYDDQCKLTCGGNTYAGYCAEGSCPTNPSNSYVCT